MKSVVSFLSGLMFLVPVLAHAATLGNPGNNQLYSGIGVISGWKCSANGPLTVRFNGGDPVPLVYGSQRPDVLEAGACSSAEVGFVAIWNWANLGDGEHTAVVYDNGVEFARSTFEVGTLGEEFVRGASKEVRVEDFPSPGESALLAWNQNTQHFEVVPESPGGDGGGDSGGDSQSTYTVGQTVPGIPPGFFIPSVTSSEDGSGSVSVSISGGSTTITWRNNHGYIEDDGRRYTCETSSGCEILDGQVTQGTIRVSTAGN